MFIRHFFRFIGHQKWIRFGIRDRVIRAFHNPDTSPSISFQVPFFNKIYQGDFATFLDWSTYYYGAYCPEELSLMHDALRGAEKPVIFDVGANIGHHSLFASTIAHEVHSFEPFQSLAAHIHYKIKTNSINNIKVHEIGLGERDGDLLYNTPLGCNSGTGSFTNVSEHHPAAIRLPVRSGDDYVKHLEISKIDFIKMDIEGFEPNALRGLRNTIRKYRPVILFEWSANLRNIKSEQADLLPEGYTIYNFVSDRIFLGVFSKSRYKLSKGAWQQADGNKVAIPDEKISTFSRSILHRGQN